MIPIYNCVIDESLGDETGIYAISFVEDPANETDFVALSKAEVFLSKDTKKQILTGVVLKPEQLIYRYSPEMGDYYIKFSAEEIEKIAFKMMRKGIALHNTTHQHEAQLQGNYLTELWIIEDPEKDKSAALGFKDLPKGTLMCSYKIQDTDYWNNEVMTGNVKGFSLEGFFAQELNMTKYNKMEEENKEVNSMLSKIWRFLLDIANVERQDVTDSGDTYREFILEDGKVVKVDSEGFATMDGVQLPSGEHMLSDGSIMVIDENGNFVETKSISVAQSESSEVVPNQNLNKEKMEEIEKLKAELSALNEELKAKNELIENQEIELSKLKEEKEQKDAEIIELKKHTPSAEPVQPKLENQTINLEGMSRCEIIARAAEAKAKRINK